MVFKNKLLILGIVFLLIFSLGCIGGSDNDNSDSGVIDEKDNQEINTNPVSGNYFIVDGVYEMSSLGTILSVTIGKGTIKSGSVIYTDCGVLKVKSVGNRDEFFESASIGESVGLNVEGSVSCYKEGKFFFD